jgi:hypothetical protein
MDNAAMKKKLQDLEDGTKLAAVVLGCVTLFFGTYALIWHSLRWFGLAEY